MTLPFLLGFAVLWAVLAGLAELDSTGRYGIAVLAAVLLAAVVVVRLQERTGPRAALSGLGRPAGRAVVVALGVAALVQLAYPLAGAGAGLRPGWPWLLLGIFAFHGLAEELVWRGYAFARLRRTRSFGGAVALSMPLIAATHLPVIATSGLAVGLAALVVAAATSLPLAHLYELGRNTIWAPAIVHTGIDSFKLVTIPDDVRLTFSLTLAAVSVLVPLLALTVRNTQMKRISS
jgi:membrane protease YdiL (CAAX protease family)